MDEHLDSEAALERAAHAAYDAYCASMLLVAPPDADMDVCAWGDLLETVKICWVAAARAALEACGLVVIG